MTIALADSLASEPDATEQTVRDCLKFREGVGAHGVVEATRRLQILARRRLQAKLAKARAAGRIIEGNHDYVSQAGKRHK